MRRLVGVCLAALLAACASIPSVEYSYYLSKSNTVVTVTQAVACGSSGTAPVVTTTSSLTTT
jgi:uncharacterized lipoprotein YmbA